MSVILVSLEKKVKIYAYKTMKNSSIKKVSICKTLELFDHVEMYIESE
jgi:hypothetical protein